MADNKLYTKDSIESLSPLERGNNICKNNNIPLIRIPYTKLDTLCINDLLLETTEFRVV